MPHLDCADRVQPIAQPTPPPPLLIGGYAARPNAIPRVVEAGRRKVGAEPRAFGTQNRCADTPLLTGAALPQRGAR